MKHYALLLLNLVLEQIQKIDPEAFAIVNKHAGKVIEITIEDIPLTFFLEVQIDNLVILPEMSDTTHLKITAPFASFVKLLFAKNPSIAFLVKNKVVIVGDTHLLHALHKMLQNFNLDIEQWMALSVGDIPATQLGTLWRSTYQHMRDTLKEQTQNISDYFTYEKGSLLSSSNFSEFSKKNASMRDEIAKLKMQLDALKKSLKKENI